MPHKNKKINKRLKNQLKIKKNRLRKNSNNRILKKKDRKQITYKKENNQWR